MSNRRFVRSQSTRGFGLLDSVVATALMMIIFVGIAGAFQLSLDVVGNNKARAGAIALANERMEYIRSLSYASLGTLGGIPSGLIAQSEEITLNGVPFTRRTYIEYEDDPKDGTGLLDSNAIEEDYKQVKVDVSWSSRNGVRHIIISSRFSPPGIETSVPGGKLVVNAVNAVGTPLSGAQVNIVNSSTLPTINLTTFTNASGTADLLGVPPASGYEITVSKSGYSTAQTYGVTAQNTNPSPTHLTVADNLTTMGTFAIDLVGTINVYTWSPIQAGTWSDTYADDTKTATTTGVTIFAGEASLEEPPPYTTGSLQTISIAPSVLSRWKTLSAIETVPAGTAITYQIYNSAGTTLIPDTDVPNNSIGNTAPISLLGISTSTYPGIRVVANFSGTNTDTPDLGSLTIGYDYGPLPLPNIVFSLAGAKTIGSGASGAIAKYSTSTLSTGVSAALSVPNLEWDTYLTSISSATGYDIASSCPAPQPQSLAPGALLNQNIFLLPHTTHSLLVSVQSSATGAPVSGATLVLTLGGSSSTASADGCGQAYFGSLSSSSGYSIEVGAPGYATSSISSVDVSGTTNLSVTLN